MVALLSFLQVDTEGRYHRGPKKGEFHYERGIKSYVGDDIDGAVNEFKTTKDYKPYQKIIQKKTDDLEEIMVFKRQNKMEEEKENEIEREK
ncbi:MAG: hypothetical protein KA369_08690 [Spirochaetes bacterium]|jgi:hypothetical protein|nr:hypothetical protein [Spirochaetota bacterium]